MIGSIKKPPPFAGGGYLFSGGDGGESNSPFQAYNLPGLLVRLLDQLSTLGETAGQIKRAFKDGTFLDL